MFGCRPSWLPCLVLCSLTGVIAQSQDRFIIQGVVRKDIPTLDFNSFSMSLNYYGRPDVTQSTYESSWFDDSDPSKHMAYSIEFKRQTQTDKWVTNLGDSWPPVTGHFTFEFQTQYDISSNVDINLQVGGDLWLFVKESNGENKNWELKGTISNSAKSVTLSSGAYNLLVFYVNSRSSGSPSLSLEMVEIITQCSALTSSKLTQGIYPLTNVNIGGDAAVIPPNNPHTILLVEAAAQKYVAPYLWFNDQRRITSGFVTEFEFDLIQQSQGVGDSEGFAFVIQGEGKDVHGSSGAQLGYNFPNCLAIEFDDYGDQSLNDPKDDFGHYVDHIAMRFEFAAPGDANPPNTAKHKDSLDRVAKINNGFSSHHAVRITYRPSSDKLIAQIQVFMDSVERLTIEIPRNEDAAIQALGGGFVWMGFTSGTSVALGDKPATWGKDVKITNWRISTTELSSLHSSFIQPPPASLVADDQIGTEFLILKAKDGCGRPIGAGGTVFGASVQLVLDGSSPPSVDIVEGKRSQTGTNLKFEDQETGEYKIWMWYQKIGTVYFTIKLNEQSITIDPYPVEITPAAIDAGSCVFSPDAISEWKVEDSFVFNLETRDRFGNLNPSPTMELKLYFSHTQDIVTRATETATAGKYTANIKTEVASTQTALYLRYIGVDINKSPIRGLEILPGPIDPDKSLLEGLFLVVIAGSLMEIRAVPKDSFLNFIDLNKVANKPEPRITISLESDTGIVLTTTPLWEDGGNSPGYWKSTVTPQIKGQYKIQFSTNSGGGYNAWKNYTSTVYASKAEAANCEITPNADYVVGTVGTVTIKTKDQFNNFRTDRVASSRTFTAKLSKDGNVVENTGEKDCHNPSTPVASEFGVATCSYDRSGSYIFQFTVLVTGNYTINALLGGASISPITISVQSTSVDPVQSTITANSSIVAGNNGTLIINFKDEYNNNVNPMLINLLRIQFLDDILVPQLTKISVGVFKQTIPSIKVNSESELNKVESKAGIYGLIVIWSLREIGSQDIEILPGPLYGPNCQAIDLYSQYNTGKKWEFTFTPRDRYGNIIGDTSSPELPSSFTVKFSDKYPSITGSVKSDGKLYRVKVTSVPQESEREFWIYLSHDTGFILNRTLHISMGNLSYAYIENVANLTDEPKQAGVPFYFTLINVDNSQPIPQILTRNEAFDATLTHSITQNIFLFAILQPGSEGLSGRYLYQVNPLFVGQYNLYVRGRGSNIDNRGLSWPLKVEIIPGNVSAQNSEARFVKENREATAGEFFKIIVELHDAQTNPLISTPLGVFPKVKSTAMPNSLGSDNFHYEEINGTYNLNIKLDTARVHILDVTLSTSTEEKIPFFAQKNSITIIAAKINQALSQVVVFPQTRPKAGQRAEFCLLAKDVFGNIVNDLTYSNDFFGNFQYDAEEKLTSLYVSPPEKSTCCETSAYDLSKVCGFIAALTPRKILSPTVDLLAKFNDTDFGITPSIEVLPGDINIGNSKVSGLKGMKFIADEDIQFSFSARDDYNNSLLKGLPSIPEIKVLGSGEKALVKALENGVYEVRVLGAYVKKAKLYTFVGSWDKTISIEHADPDRYLKAEVIAGSANAKFTVISADSYLTDSGIQFTAGEYGFFTATLYDKNKNQIKKKTADKVEIFFVKGWSANERCSASQEEPNITADVTSSIFSQSVSQQEKDGTWNISLINVTKAGKYSLFVKVNFEWTYMLTKHSLCADATPLFEVIHGALAPWNSDIAGATDGIAGSESEITITTRDSFGNRFISNELINLSLECKKCAPNIACVCSNILRGPQPNCDNLNFFPGANYVPINNGNGVYTVRFTFKVTNTFTLIALVNDSLVGKPDTCTQIVIKPWYVYRFNRTYENKPVLAGKLSSFMLQGFDFFGNKVGQKFGSKHSFTMEMIRANNLSISPVREYAFKIQSQVDTEQLSTKLGRVYTTASGQGNRHIIYYFPEWPGTYTQLITINPDPKYINEIKYERQKSSVEHLSIEPYLCAASQDSHPYRCRNGNCQSSFAQCNENVSCSSNRCCPPNFTPCDSAQGNACTSNISQCFSSSSCTDCPTPNYFCKPPHYICGDGSCEANKDSCRNVAPCNFANDKKCTDGTCHASPNECSSQMVCPVGWIKCSMGCASTESECQPSNCKSSEVRCPDGNCRNNFVLCPTVVTCNGATPVRCADGSCVERFALCRRQVQCSILAPFRCADGSCAHSREYCPTTVTCPPTRSIKCQDGSCANSIGDCNSALLNISLHYCLPQQNVCPDGSCRDDFHDCPSLSTCPLSKPVRCVDGSCSAGALSCSAFAATLCDPGRVYCPGGGCADSYTACPTHRACGSRYVRCLDGVCRRSGQCTNDTSSSVSCFGQVTCPQTLQGIVCASTLEECPQEQVCPPTAPVRCPDVQCALTLSECPPIPQPNSLTNQPCPEGSFVLDQSLCGIVVCPHDTPIKCWDRSCRVVTEDCPPSPPCPARTPYLCPSGLCVNDVYKCQSSKTCQSNATVGSIRCSIGGCKTSQKSCSSFLNMTMEESDSLRRRQLECADGHRCKDGSCRGTKEWCRDWQKNLNCPMYLPHLCNNGLCAKNSYECNIKTNGCPNAQPNLCQGCKCMVTCLPDEFLSDMFRCMDGKCVPKTDLSEKKTLCIDGLDTTTNSCPFTHPYRCPNGQCVGSSRYCPVYVKPVTQRRRLSANGPGPVLCADGSYVLSAIQCPVKPCTDECNSWSMECSDGRCLADDSMRSPNGCASSAEYKCPDGSCKADISCPVNQLKCQEFMFVCDGSCTNSPSSCVSLKLASNNCPVDKPIRCADGLCKKYPAHHSHISSQDSCLPVVVCTGIEPYLCKDGTCVAQKKLCRPVVFDSSCPSGKIICPNHSCADKQSDCERECPPTLATLCPDGACRRSLRECNLDHNPCPEGEFKCWYGGCVSKLLDCVYQSLLVQKKNFEYNKLTLSSDVCGSGDHLCYDGSCNKPFLCPATPNCPPFYFRCADGSCQEEESKCSASYRQTVLQCSGGIRCADGICRDLCFDLGCPVNTYFCPDSTIMCSDTMCDTNQRGICTTGCERNIDISVHSVSVPLEIDTIVDVNLDNNHIPRTRLFVPSGAFGKAAHLSIHAVAHSDVYLNGYLFPSPLLSAPFSCSVNDSVDQPFALDVIVNGAITQKIDDFKTGTSSTLKVPCELIADYDLRRLIDSSFGVIECNLQLRLTINQYIRTWGTLWDQTCRQALPMRSANLKSVDLPETYQSTWDSDEVVIPWDESIKESRHCLCFTIKDSNITMEIDQVLCLAFYRDSEKIFMFQYKNPDDANKCPSTKLSNANTIESQQLIRYTESENVCQTDSEDILPIDICLASTPLCLELRALQNMMGIISNCQPNWQCVESPSDRIGDWIPWKPEYGVPKHRVRGRIDKCDKNGKKMAYAFIYKPLPVGDYASLYTKSFWEQNSLSIILSSSFFILFLVLAAYVIWRLYRYREKYLATKARHDDVQDEIRHKEEFHGGMGVGDEDVAMQPNPLVIKQNDAQEQLKKVQQDLKIQEGKDKKTIDNLNKEKQRLVQEIDRIQKQISEQQQAPSRIVEDAPNNAATNNEIKMVESKLLQPAKNDFGSAAPKKNQFGVSKPRTKKNIV